MKCFSSLIVFVMMFASLSIACADVALPPRPRPVVENQFVTIDKDVYKGIRLEFNFPAECDYEYQLIDKATGDKISSDNGSYSDDYSKTYYLGLHKYLKGTCERKFLLKVQVSNVKEKTRFGVKIRKDKFNITKTIVVEADDEDGIINLNVYDGETN